MRSAEQAHVSTVSHLAPRLLLARVLAAVLATVALLFTWHPAVVHAQVAPSIDSTQPAQPPKAASARTVSVKDTASKTHVVKAGETLWSITTRYYGDGHQWRAVARRNGIELSGDTALRIGSKLVIPSRRSVASVASAVAALPAPRDTTTPKIATTPAAAARPAPKTSGPVVTRRPGGALATQTSGKPNASASATPRSAAGTRNTSRDVKTVSSVIRRDSSAARDTAAMTLLAPLPPTVKAERLLGNVPGRIGLVDNADLQAARPRGESPTVFLLRVPDASLAAASARSVALHAEVAPRHGEYVAAPFTIADARWQQAGRLVRRLDNGSSSIPAATRMQLADEVEIAPPVGVTLSVGDRLVAVRRGGLLSSGVTVGIPTGVLQVTRAERGKPIHARVRSESGVVEQDEALFPLEGAAAPAGHATESASSSDVETRVMWIDAAELLPTLQSYVLLAAGQAQGVKAGEQFALVRRSATGGEDRIAVVRVVRVGMTGSSAIVISQSLPEIASGVLARRIVRRP